MAQNNSVFVQKTSTYSRGRPNLRIDMTQVANLKLLGFTWKKIANLLGACTSFVHKNRTVEEMESNYSNIVDDDLDVIVTNIYRDSPNMGEKMMTGALRSHGIKVQRVRMRQSMTRVNPSRQLHTRRIERRVYNICAPNALW